MKTLSHKAHYCGPHTVLKPFSFSTVLSYAVVLSKKRHKPVQYYSGSGPSDVEICIVKITMFNSSVILT